MLVCVVIVVVYVEIVVLVVIGYQIFCMNCFVELFEGIVVGI